MGLCRDFGSQIAEGCDHPMRAGSDSCHCEECGVICSGRFEACPAVWALGPQTVVLVAEPTADMLKGPNYETLAANGHDTPGPHAKSPVAEGAKASTNGHASAPGSAQPSAPSGREPAAEAFGWFQNAFDALRQEVAGLRSALAQEQTLVATLLEVKVAETDRNAESEQALLEATVREAVKLETSGIAPALEALRNEIVRVRSAQEKLEAGLQAATDASRADLPAELNRRDSANRRAFRATLAQELQPLVEVVAESVAQSEYQLEVLDRKLDSLESGMSLAAAVTEMTESSNALAVGNSAPVDTSPETRRTQQRVSGQGNADNSLPTPRATSTRASTPALSRPKARPASSKSTTESPGRFVSLRNRNPED